MWNRFIGSTPYIKSKVNYFVNCTLETREQSKLMIQIMHYDKFFGRKFYCFLRHSSTFPIPKCEFSVVKCRLFDWITINVRDNKNPPNGRGWILQGIWQRSATQNFLKTHISQCCGKQQKKSFIMNKHFLPCLHFITLHRFVLKCNN